MMMGAFFEPNTLCGSISETPCIACGRGAAKTRRLKCWPSARTPMAASARKTTLITRATVNRRITKPPRKSAMRCEFVSTEFYRGIDESQRRNPRKRDPNRLNSLLSVGCPGSSARFPPEPRANEPALASAADNQKKGEETPTRRVVSFKEREQLYHCKGVAVFLP